MAEACSVSQDNSKRCLPAWMLKPCSNNEVSKTQYRNEPVLESNNNKKPADLDQIKPVKRKRGRQAKTVDAEDADELGALQPCQGWKKVRRKCMNVVKDDHEESAKVTNKNARKVRRRSAHSSKQKLGNVEPEVSSSGAVDDDIELTVEDLLSIAEEYVKADRLKQHEVETTKTARYNEHRCNPSISTDSDIGGSIINARSMKSLPDTTKTITAPSEPSTDEINKQQVQQCMPSFTATGDIAQDMLNIFFGPLLSKCSQIEKKSEAIESLVQNANHATEKKDLSCGVQRQREYGTEKKDLSCDVQWQEEYAKEKKHQSCDVQRQGGSVTKKKSSLRDKVSLFF